MGNSIIKGPFLGPFARVPYYFGDPKKGPSLENYPCCKPNESLLVLYIISRPAVRWLWLSRCRAGLHTGPEKWPLVVQKAGVDTLYI